jgi:phospholipid/cholesterol/gamma-HCH transport system substrate-binding protein
VKGSSAIKVGLLALIVLAATYLGIKWIYKGGGFTQKGYKLWGLFTDATGLVDKSRVQIAGLPVGTIVKRELPPDHPNRAKITIQIDDKSVEIYVRDEDKFAPGSAKLYKKSASLLGEFYLEIDPGAPSHVANGVEIKHRRLKDGDQLPVVIEPASFGDIQRQISETIPLLKDILGDVRDMTSGPVKQMVENANRALVENSEALHRLLEDADRAAADVGNITGRTREDIVITLKNIRDVTEGVKQLVGTQAPTKQRTEDVLVKVDNAASKLDHTLKELDEIVTRTNAGHGTVGRLFKDEAIAENVQQITEDAGGFIRSLTHLQTIVGLRSEYNVLANTLKTYVAIQIAPRPDKYYLIELIDDPRGVRHQQITLTNTDDPTKPGSTLTQTVTVTDQFRFSFQFAKRALPYTTLRFGIKESTGGIGADFDMHFLTKPLEVGLDLFDFRSNVFPRLKVIAALEFFKGLFLVGGIDDMLNTRAQVGAGGGRDFFIGLQLKFNDEDLRGLLLVGGAFLAGAASSK